MSIYLKSGTVKPEWTDYNNHMNLAYYIHLFDVSWEIILEQFTMGEDSAKNHGKGTFAVESHTTYDMEVQLGDDVDINLMFFYHDKKRIICKMEMINKQKQYLAATSEILSLYVDLNTRKVIEFEEQKILIMEDFIKLNQKKFNPGNLVFSNKLKK